MKRNKLWIKVLILCLSSGFLAKSPATAMQTNQPEQSNLMKLITDEASKRKIAPIDARTDKVWGGIPGYNGIEVDVNKTYELNKGLTDLNSIQYEYQEIQPKIHLEDLGAQPIFMGNPSKPMVSLMINVAWGNEYIPQMLDILKKHHIKTTFFFDGSWLSKNGDLANQIAEQGHELSNHAYSHKNMSRLSKSQAVQEITKTEHLLSSTFRIQNTLFAPPSGDYDMTTVNIAKELHLKTILWTLDTVDWKNPPPQAIIEKMDRKVKAGYLILMHPTKSSSQALDGMIQVIERKGLKVGTVSEVISEKRVKNEDQSGR